MDIGVVHGFRSENDSTLTTNNEVVKTIACSPASNDPERGQQTKTLHPIELRCAAYMFIYTCETGVDWV